MRSLGIADGAAGAREREVLQRLQQIRETRSRYAIERTLGSGGMGVVYAVRDRALDRVLAMKVPHGRSGGGRLRRFLEEAELLGRLDHPGILSVHELGIDERGEVYFTMPRVEGQRLSEVFELARAGSDGWSQARVLEVLLKVCDALAYAHERGVVHRDLKPENVLVGRFGQVHVVDWGLAHVPRAHAAAEAGSEAHAPASVQTARGSGASEAEQGAPNPDPRQTLAGEVIGTPAYMAPEQAQGRNEEVGPRADVYALGAMLYHLLAGRMPHAHGAARPKSAEVLRAVLAGPPVDVAELAPGAPAELVAICHKAMRREPAARYASVTELAADLRAFLDGRVVRAHERGAWAELRKWVQRNRGLALALLVLLLVTWSGLFLVIRGERERVELAQRQADARALDALRAEAAELWPAVPARIPALERWLAEAREVLGRRAQREAELEPLRRSASAQAAGTHAAGSARARLEDSAARLRAEIAGWNEELADMAAHSSGLGLAQGTLLAHERSARASRRLARIEAQLADPDPSALRDPRERERYGELLGIVRDLQELADPAEGLLVSLEARLAAARALEQQSLIDAADEWQRALASIADPAQCPPYRGLRMRPQVGLVPIGRDPASGLWEFAHLASGRPARRGAEGALAIEPETGIVLVLVPPGEFSDWQAQTGRAIRLEAFFVSKYEVSQSQWYRLSDEVPSYFRVGKHFDNRARRSLPPEPEQTITWTFPVEQISWDTTVQVLARCGLRLPTEVQWEYAGRAGTHTPWCFGADPAALVGKVNATHVNADSLPWDGYFRSAPVDCFAANAWGLLNVHGNVSEWVEDWFWVGVRFPVRDGDGLQLAPDSGLKIVRGGNYWGDADNLAFSERNEQVPTTTEWQIGVRPARAIDP